MIIAFGHEKNAGKDTCAKFLATNLRLNKKNIDVQRHGLADKIKDITWQLYWWAGLQQKEFYEQNPQFKEVLLPKLGKTARQIWIEFGTSVGREIYSNTWIDYLFNKIQCNFLIITDLRFPNEAQRIHELDGKIIKIVRPSVPHTSDIADDPLLDYTDWDFIINNEGTLHDLNDSVIQMMEYFQL